MKILIDDFLSLSLAISGLISISPFFTYNYFGLFYIFCLVITIISFLLKQSMYINKNDLFMVVIILLYSSINYNYNYQQANLSQFFILTLPFICIFILSGRNIRILTVHFFVKLICFIFILSLFCSFLLMLGFKSILPSYSFSAGNGEFTVYLFTVVRNGLQWDINGGLFHRFHSIFMEPGFVGTISAFIVCSFKFDLRNRYCLITFIAGLISTSFAFYIISSLYLIIRYPIKGCFFLIFILYMIVFIDHPFINQLVIDRFTGGGSHLDTRTSIYELSQIECFWNWLFYGSIFQLLFGLGDNIPGSTGSYRYFLLSYGLVGVVFFSSLYVYLYIFDKIKYSLYRWDDLLFLGVFILSIYQRPYVDNYYMLLVFSIFLYSSTFDKIGKS